MKSRLKNYLSLVYFAVPALVFSADIIPSGMQSLTDSILETFTGTLVRTIMIIMLVGVAIAYGFNKDNDQLKRKLLAIGIAIAIICGAQAIIGVLWTASGGK